MRVGILVIGGALLLAMATPSRADVNCKQVNKYLQTGRSVKDVAETMVVGEDEVEKCKEQAADAAKGGGDAKPGDKAGEGEKK